MKLTLKLARLARPAVLLAALATTFTAPAATPSLFLYDADGIASFDLYGSGLLWWNGPGVCSGEFPNNATLKLKGTLAGSTATNSRSCTIRQGPYDRPVRDDAYVYFFSNGQLQRKALNAGVASAPQAMNTAPLTPTLANILLGAVLEYAQGYLYFARYNAGLADFYSFKTDGSQAPVSLGSINGAGNVAKIKLFNFRDNVAGDIDALAVLLDNGRLYQRNFTRGGTFVLIASGVVDFAVHSRTFIFGGGKITDVYAAKGTFTPGPSTGPGSLVRINADTGAASTVYTAPGDNQVLSVATDADELVTFDGEESQVYFAEASVSCGQLFCSTVDTFIRRNTTPGTDGTWDLIVSTAGGVNLRVDQDNVWMVRTNALKRIATDAPPIEFDFKADLLEVVQITQRPTNGLSLVAYKDGTFARGYAHLRTNTTGQAAWFPSARLSVFINGVEIPGSPLQNINNASVTTNASTILARTNPALAGFLFQLPRLAPGALTMTMTVNPDQVLVETGPSPYANNSVSLPAPVSVVGGSYPCLVMLPVSTPWGTFTHTSDGFYDILGRCNSLLPVQNLWFYANYSPHGNLLTDTMFNAGADGGDSATLDVVECVAEQTANPTGCPDTHWIGMVHPGTTNFNGLGYRPGRSLIVRMEPTANGLLPWNAPRGGRSMAHELGHNYNRKHVNCGGPADPDGSYPYNSCDFGTYGPNGWVGFDSLTQTPIDPTRFGDLMSYATNRWVSDYTFTAIYSAAPKADGLAAFAESGSVKGAKANAQLLIQGYVQTAQNNAVFQAFYLYPDGTADPLRLTESAAKAARAGATPDPFRVLMLNAAGQTLGSTPIEALQPEDGSDGNLRFIQYVPFPPSTRRILLVRGNQLFVERVVSAHPPTLSLEPVTVDAPSQTLSLAWTASDSDGDPLVFGVQYSPDNGATWYALLVNYLWQSATLKTSLLPGGNLARLRVLASDGVNTTFAVSAPFVLPKHAPQPQIAGVAEGERIPFGSVRKLTGVGFDAEEGSLGPRLLWNITGPTPVGGTEPTVLLAELAPGPYTATLSATDSDNQTGMAVKHFEIMPIPVPDALYAPTLDGVPDAAYENATFVRIPLGNGRFALARMVHYGTDLFVAFTDLQLPAAGQKRVVGLRVDANASRNPLAQPGDVGFFVNDSGIPFQEVGNGAGMVENLTPPLGFTAAVKRSATGWNAEFRIADSLVGGWNHLAAVMLDHDTPHWPPQATDGGPTTWAPAWFGASPPAGTNRPPIANAGAALQLHVGAPRPVVLDGTMSYDPDGDALAFLWTQVGGPTVALQNATSPAAIFTTPPVSSPTLLTFRLRVNDSTTSSAPADTTVTLLPTTRPAISPQLVHGQFNDGLFQVSFTGDPGRSYVLQATTNLTNWVNIRTNTADFQGVLDFLDLDTAQFPYRFYRLGAP